MVPPEATTAQIRGSSASSGSSAAPVRWPRSSTGTLTTSMSSRRAAEATEEWAVEAQASAQPPSGRRPRSRSAWSRAVASAERFPWVPPETNTPAASAGQPSRSASQRSTWFSAKIAPAPFSQIPPNTFAAETTVSKATAARVGAAGM